MRTYYRISDKSYPKIKLPGATKRYCLENFIEVFKPGTDELTIVADNCGPDLLKWLKSLNYRVLNTSYGNAGALLYSIKDALNDPHDEWWMMDPLYFVEDDYLHNPSSAYRLMLEGHHCTKDHKVGPKKTDYWTLFDHPDKYSYMYGYSEIGKLFRTNHGHWKQTVSTTMTFATSSMTLGKDLPVWEKYLSGVGHPPDHEIFLELGKAGRELYCSVPGAAFHTDLTGYDGLSIPVIDQFALDMVYDKIYSEIMRDLEAASLIKEMVGENPEKSFCNLARLAALQANLE